PAPPAPAPDEAVAVVLDRGPRLLRRRRRAAPPAGRGAPPPRGRLQLPEVERVGAHGALARLRPAGGRVPLRAQRRRGHLRRAPARGVPELRRGGGVRRGADALLQLRRSTRRP